MLITQVFPIALLLVLPFVAARPWNVTTFEPDSISPSQLMVTIDSMSTRVTKALQSASPQLTPILTAASLAYVGYVGSVMFFPAALREAGIPLLEEFKLESKMSRRTVETGFIDSLATGYMKDMIGRTEVADVVRNTSMSAVNNGMGALRKATRFLNVGVGSLQGLVNRATTFFSQDCLAKTMCQVGQFTSFHLPVLGPVLRSINTFDLDEFSQALIDGTTIGDCSAVYFNCPTGNSDI